MFRFNAIITDTDGLEKDATYYFDSRKSARHWARRNARRGWLQEAVLFDFQGRTPLAAWESTGRGDYRYIPGEELLAA